MSVISVGQEAINRSASWNNDELTCITRAGPASGSGVLDTIEVWAQEHAYGFVAGTVYGSSKSWTRRGYTNIGTVPSGAKRTFSGLDVDVETDDLIAFYFTSGGVEMATGGGSGNFYFSGNALVDGGTETYTEQSSAWAFSLLGTGVSNSVPTAPTSLQCEGATNPQAVTDLTPEFSAIFNDPDSGDTSTKFEVEVNANSGFTGTVMWDSGYLTIASVSKGNRCAAVSYAGTALTKNGTTYYWRCRFQDAGAEDSPWSAEANFEMQGVYDEAFNETIALPEALSKGMVQNSLSESIALPEHLSKMMTRSPFEEIVSTVDAMSKSVEKDVFAESVATSDATISKSMIRSPFLESVATSDATISKSMIRSPFLESLSMTTENIQDRVKTLGEILAMADDMDFISNFTRGYAEQLGIADSIAKAMAIAVEEDMSLAGDISKAMVAIMTGETLGIEDSVSFSTLRTLVETLSVSAQASLLLSLNRSLAEAVSVSGSLATQSSLTRDLEEALPFAAAVSKAIVKDDLEDTISLDSEEMNHIARTLADQFDFSESYILHTIRDIIILENMGMSSGISTLRAMDRILAELLPMGDRLRLGGVWDDPNTKIVLSMLKAALKSEVN